MENSRSRLGWNRIVVSREALPVCWQVPSFLLLRVFIGSGERGKRVGGWSIGVLEYWSIGVLEYWSIGVLEGWRVGVKRLRLDSTKG
jgi:hypothetical protein